MKGPRGIGAARGPAIARRARRLTALAAVLLAGCGGDERGPASAGRLPLVAAIGDSITAGSPLWDPDPALRTRIDDPDEQSQYEFWAQGRLGVEFRNCGVSGQTTAEIAKRLDGCMRGADALIVQGGLNDLVLHDPPARIAARLQAMVARGKEAGKTVMLAELIPWNGDPGAAPRIEELNRLIAEVGREEGVRVLPFHKALEDPDRPGRMLDEYTDDRVHPSVEGYERMADVIPAP